MPSIEGRQDTTGIHQGDLLTRATSLLRQERLEGRRLKSYEVRTITSAYKLLISTARNLLVQNRATVVAFESEFSLALDRLKNRPK